ncbi:MAG: hypothetical protein Ct9H300mP21_11090 [Pseudomonadota bacterium]|nr:MAG: hypothetical protein Ct9H300mP21_11090 [Pseudomonadota bacterium]
MWGFSQAKMGVVIGDSLLFHSIHPISNDFPFLSYTIPFQTSPFLFSPQRTFRLCYIFLLPLFSHLVFPHIFKSTWKSECSVTILFPFFPILPHIFFHQGKSLYQGHLVSCSQRLPYIGGGMSLSPNSLN